MILKYFFYSQTLTYDIRYGEFNFGLIWVQQYNKLYLLGLDATKNKQRKGQSHSTLTTCPEPWSDHESTAPAENKKGSQVEI